MNKLSKYQEELLTKAKALINNARQFETFENYLKAEEGKPIEDYIKLFRNRKAEEIERHINYRKNKWNEYKNGIVIISEIMRRNNIKTIEKLAKMELIEIIDADKYRNNKFIIDKIRIKD
jgi:hypothetical protein